ncbi:hypothetical protein WJX77_004147 [Trebouxia sp. C0004]
MPILLGTYWTLAAGAAAFALLPVDLAPGVRNAVQLSAARGKLCDNSPRAQLGCLTNIVVPQQWFLHFYVAGSVCNTCLLYCVLTSWPHCDTSSPQKQAISLASLVLLELHLVRRMVETACIMKYPIDAKMHLIAYVFGLSYYVVLPLSCLPMASFGDWKYISDRQPGSISMWTMLGLIALKPRHQLGVCMFLAGNALQGWSHCILASLRHTTAQTVIKERDFYQVPQGGPFHWVSCPHYLGEIVIYAGLALLAGQELPLTLLVLCWVVANLLLAAQPTHQWYQRQFPDYPKNRTALIPYLY